MIRLPVGQTRKCVPTSGITQRINFSSSQRGPRPVLEPTHSPDQQVPVWDKWPEHEVGQSPTYRVSHELRSLLREGVPYVKLYRYNPKHLYPKLNGFGDNGHRNVWASGVSTYCTPSVTSYCPMRPPAKETW